jgi:hypothetical protein
MSLTDDELREELIRIAPMESRSVYLAYIDHQQQRYTTVWQRPDYHTAKGPRYGSYADAYRKFDLSLKAIGQLLQNVEQSSYCGDIEEIMLKSDRIENRHYIFATNVGPGRYLLQVAQDIALTHYRHDQIAAVKAFLKSV